MPIHCHEFGSTAVARVRDSDDLRQLLVDPCFKSETIIIKPNWVSTELTDFIDAKTMRMLFDALGSRIVVTESQ